MSRPSAPDAATFIEIPKVNSSSIELTAPSFLTTLPPEIRNNVYELLFKGDSPVLLLDVKNYLQIQRERRV